MSELGNLIELLGDQLALQLIELHGGTRLNVPRAIGEEHPLRAALGARGVELLVRYFGGAEIKVPMARPWRAAIYRTRGLTYREIARRLGCTETAVYGYMARARSAAQPELPF